MDAFDLFRKLGSGAKFDLKRFAKDAERFKVGLMLSSQQRSRLLACCFLNPKECVVFNLKCCHMANMCFHFPLNVHGNANANTNKPK